MKFYDCKQAPSPRRSRIFIAEKGIEGIEYIQLDLGKGEQFSESFKAKNPMCAVPVLELDDGTCISESAAINCYFEELQAEPNLLGRDVFEKTMIQQWLSRIEQNLWLPVGMSFQHGHDFFKGTREQVKEIVPVCIIKVEKFLDFLNQQLSEQAFICCDRFTAVDINALVAIYFAKVSAITIGDREHLAAWHESMSARPSCQA